MPLADWGKRHLADRVFAGGQALEGTWYLALLTAVPDETDTGATISEPSDGYSRVAVTNDGTEFDAAVGDGEITLANEQTFPQASGEWGRILAGAIVDAASGGNLLGWGRISSAPTIVSGQTPRIPSGTTVFTF